MKNKWTKLGCAAAVLAAAVSVQAGSINGYVGFNGDYVQVGGSPTDLGTAISMTIPKPLSVVTVNGAETGGDFAGATLNAFVASVGVNGHAPALTAQQLWSITASGNVYTFTVTSVAQTLNGPKTGLDLAGMGIIEENGNALTDTSGTYDLTFSEAGGASFTFAATSATNAPDGGTTAMLLGAALSGVGLLRRKLIA